MASQLVLDCALALAERQYTIFFAESATAGRHCAEFALSPHSGKILLGGICCYDVSIKEQFLKVPHPLIEKCTPESTEVTACLAQNSAGIFKADITVAVTGLTTPGGSETPQKPVGTMFLHIIFPDGEISHREVFGGDPQAIISKAIDRAAALIRNRISKP